MTQQLTKPSTTRALGVYYIVNAFTMAKDEPWLVNALTWCASHVSDAAWPHFVERLTTEAEKRNPWAAPCWSTRLVDVQKAILKLLLPVVTEPWVQQALDLLDRADASWEAFVREAEVAGNPSPTYTFTVDGAAAVAASCCHPPILSPHAPTVEAYRAIWNGQTSMTSVADWTSLALLEAGREDGDDLIVNAVLAVFEG